MKYLLSSLLRPLVIAELNFLLAQLINSSTALILVFNPAFSTPYVILYPHMGNNFVSDGHVCNTFCPALLKLINVWFMNFRLGLTYICMLLLYLWDKKVCLSITKSIKCPSLTKNKRAVFSLAKPNIWHFPFKAMMENNYFFVTLHCYHQRTTLQRKPRQKPNS